MMYEVYLDGNLLYYPNDETFVILNSQLDLALNEAGSFEFDIPEYNLRFNDFKLRKSMIQVLQNGKEIFYGEVREVTQNFDFTKHVYAVGELAFLFDSIQPQAVYQGSPYDMLKSMIDQHNAQVEDRKKFEIGSVTAEDGYVYHFTNREDTLTDIREKLCKTLNVFIKIEKTANRRLLSLVPLANYGTYCRQEIQFGENLIDYSNNMSAQDIATCCIPLGKRLEDEERTGDCPDGLDEYLTIVGTSANDYHKKEENDYVQIDSAIANYGYVRVVKHWDEVTLKDNLQKKAIDWLKSAQYENMTLEITALDQNLLDINIDSFDVGDTIHVWAEPFGMDTTFPVRKKSIYINDLAKNSVTLGSTVQKSLTTQNSEAVAKLNEEIPEVSPILKSAKDNALAQLLAQTTGGHIVYEYDSTKSYIEAINVCNALTIEESTQRWVINLRGIGFMSRESKNDKWSDLSVAITMDGHIVSNFMTTGLLKLTGATTGGDGVDSNVHLKVYDGATEVGAWGSDGIKIKKGSLDIGGNFKVGTDGKLTATSASLSGHVNASTGSIGGWDIDSTGLSKGPASIWSTTNGMHVGTDGLRSNKDGNYVIIANGSLSTNTNFNSGIIGASNYITAPRYYVGTTAGATGIVTWTDSVLRKAYVINVVNGIVIQIESKSY